ncbi:hypothetical protein AXK58_13775 [Tsukamurella tyrosinosolvens]|nr:hypothetical protein AXK58_13775 [Tsukamurella tyrosinosolvens]
MTASNEHWLTRQARISARRLAEADPHLLSPVGRDLRDDAIRWLGDRTRRHLRLIAADNPNTSD